MISGKTILSFLSSVLTLLQQEGLTTFATLASSSSTAVSRKLLPPKCSITASTYVP